MARSPLPLLLACALCCVPAAFAQDSEGGQPNPAPDPPAEEPPTGEPPTEVDWQGMELTPQQIDFPSNAVVEYDVARIAGNDPKLDGDTVDDVWLSLTDRIIPLAPGGPPAKGAAPELHLKAYHNGVQLYLLLIWPDATYNDDAAFAQWDEVRKAYVTDEDGDDSVMVFWRAWGDFHGAQVQGEGAGADTWLWSAGLTNPTGYACDGWASQQRQKDADQRAQKLSAVDSGSMWVVEADDSGRKCYAWVPLPKGFEGQTLMRVEPRQPLDSGADVRARGMFTREAGWQVEMMRPLTTFADDDVQFGSYRWFDVAFEIHDGAGGTWRSDVIGLRLLD